MPQISELREYSNILSIRLSAYYRVLRKYLNHNSMNCEQFDNSMFTYLSKKQ